MNYKDQYDRIELWGVKKAFANHIQAELLIVAANVQKRKVTVSADNGESLCLRLPKEIIGADFPHTYNGQIIPIYDHSLANKTN